jgi:plastocyanin
MNRYRHCFTVRFVLLAVLILPLPALAGTLSGKVKAQGLRTAENIMVYLDKIESPVKAAKPFTMDQKNLTFHPHILPIPLGSTVVFPNNDKVDHNVFSLSRTAPFNLGTYKPGQKKSVRFDVPGIVELRCDVHAEMMAYIMVLKNPYVAVTDKAGNFQIPDPSWLKSAGITGAETIPPGTYRLKTWHEKLRPVSQKISVSKTGKTSVELSAKRGPVGSVLYK